MPMLHEETRGALGRISPPLIARGTYEMEVDKMIVRMVLELACNVTDMTGKPPPEGCEEALVRTVGGRPDKADPLLVATNRGYLIGEAQAKGWQFIQAGQSPTGDEVNICPACWAKKDWGRK